MPRSDTHSGWPRTIRRRLPVPLSVALHAAVFYAVGLAPWAASEMPQSAGPETQVVWLAPPLVAVPRERALDPAEATAIEPTPSEEPRLEERTANLDPPPSEPPRRELVPAPVASEPIARSTEPAAPARDAEEPAGAGDATTDAPPEVDWDKERQDAVRDVIERRAREREYLTFSVDDLVEEPEPADPVPLPLVVDNCVIVKGRLQRFAALMMGRCVREARADLFAAIKPAYLKAHPVCVETRPDNPGSFLSDGTRISTVKCELVAKEE